jgi:ABC-type nitrate/sulfonate/bicarbonate transport system ATPase subunit
MTVEQNIVFGLNMKKFPKTVIKDTVKEALEMAGLIKYRDYYPVELSTSMLQRIVIVRDFAVNPELLLTDEPYRQLDVELRFKLEDELLKLWWQTGTAVIFLTHNSEEAVYLSGNILVLTNKPTTLKEQMANNLQSPRNVVSLKFIEVSKYFYFMKESMKALTVKRLVLAAGLIGAAIFSRPVQNPGNGGSITVKQDGTGDYTTIGRGEYSGLP